MQKRIILIGAAASGKDYFRDYLRYTKKLDVSYTTRPPRDGEKSGYTYNYISEKDFIKKKREGFFLEAISFNGWWYGTSNESWCSKKIFIMTPSGTLHIPKKDRPYCVFIYFDIPLEVRRKRLSNRSDSDSADRRVNADEVDFKNFKDFNIRVTNPLFNCGHLYNTSLTYLKI